MKRTGLSAAALGLALTGVGCGGEERASAPGHDGIYSFADACVAVEVASPGGEEFGFLAPSASGEELELGDRDGAARFRMKPSGLGVYLFYDEGGHYLQAGDEGLVRAAELAERPAAIGEDFESRAEWALAISEDDPDRFALENVDAERYVAAGGLAEDLAGAAEVTLFEETGCAEFPELTTDADGAIDKTEWPDGSVYGVVDTHSHIMTNLAFGGGGVFHGAPYHRLGVEYALPNCAANHGAQGREDFLGFGFDEAGRGDLDETLLYSLLVGQLPDENHGVDGYPTFSDWPDAHGSSTHQTQYYKWLERAYLGGLRLVVQHATSNQVLCELFDGIGTQPARYDCNDMVATDRILEETYAMERYIDAQEGGPGEGWFRVVTSPEEARDEIRAGNMAVILGIEVSNLFDCFLVPPEGAPACDAAHIEAELDRYYEKGVRAIFPVHKHDNALSAGDGDRGITELGNFVQTGHYLNFTEECPDVPTAFDRGDVTFGELNEPRDDYFADPPFDMTGFADDPIDVLFEFADELQGGGLEGDYCQNAGLTELGEHLIEELIARGMIIELDHLPPRAYERAFEIIEQHDYPAAGTHGLNNEGALYELGGVSKVNFGRCRDPEEDGAMAAPFLSRIELIEARGGFPAEGFGFDLNGFAGAPGPRLGEDSVCDEPQDDPITYPFESFAGDVTFEQPRVGERVVDFNKEGLVHIGLMPELVEEVRRDGVTDDDLEPLFKSAEGYLRMWELAESRATD